MVKFEGAALLSTRRKIRRLFIKVDVMLILCLVCLHNDNNEMLRLQVGNYSVWFDVVL